MCTPRRHGDNRGNRHKEISSHGVAADYPFLDILGTMLVFFGFVIWFWLLIRVFGDVFRRNDIGGWAKFFWSVFVIVVPLLGVLIYLIAQGEKIGERDMDAAKAHKAEFDAYVREAAGNGGPARDRAGEAAARQRHDQPGRVRRASSRRPWHSLLTGAPRHNLKRAAEDGRGGVIATAQGPQDTAPDSARHALCGARPGCSSRFGLAMRCVRVVTERQRELRASLAGDAPKPL